MELPLGVRVRGLDVFHDERGDVMEIFRDVWDTGVRPVQWNAVRSRPGTMRGVHVHPLHEDYFVLLEGAVCVGLRDVRRGSPTEHLIAVVDLDGAAPSAISIPRGVAHGFQFSRPSFHVYGLSRSWAPEDYHGCRFDDPELGIPWPAPGGILSPKDADAVSFRTMMQGLEPWQPFSS